MAQEGLKLTAKAVVKIRKYDEDMNLIDYEEHKVDLTEEEAEALWRLQQQE